MFLHAFDAIADSGADVPIRRADARRPSPRNEFRRYTRRGVPRTLIVVMGAASLSLGAASMVSAAPGRSLDRHLGALASRGRGTLDSLLVGDPLRGGTPVDPMSLTACSSRVTAGLRRMVAGTKRVTAAYDTWAATNPNGEEIALIGLAAFTGAKTSYLGQTLVNETCTNLGGAVPTTTSRARELATSRRANCSDVLGDVVTVVTWSKANVQAVVIIDGVSPQNALAEATALHQETRIPKTGVVTTSVRKWTMHGDTTSLSRAQRRAIATIASIWSQVLLISIRFTARSGVAASSRGPGLASVNHVARYLSARLKSEAARRKRWRPGSP